MNKISEIYISEGPAGRKLLEWIASGKYRCSTHYDAEEQLKTAKKIAALEDPKARELSLALLEKIGAMVKLLDEAKSDYAMIHRELVALDAKFNPPNA
jgi:hypothetical protein